MSPTEVKETITETKLRKIAILSSSDSRKEFHSLMHHYNMESLKVCFKELGMKKSSGPDGVTKKEYRKDLDRNLRELLVRMRSMSYKPGPVRQVLIPKEGAKGKKRSLGISNFEDKIFMKMTQKLLESIYEPLFRDCSYGFRPGRGCHDAIKELRDYLFKTKVQMVIDVDIQNFFGSIDHNILMEFIQRKIKDTRFIRYLIRTLKAGVLTSGELKVSDEGVAQGSPCSPVLANIFAHYVIDEWFEEVVKQRCRGKVALFRYCDDNVICCENEIDARRILTALRNRLAKYKLELNEEKTKLIRFSKEGFRAGIKQQTFDFLGFTFYLAPTRTGITTAKVKSSGKRMRSKLKKVKIWCKQIVGREPMQHIWKKFCIKLAGHIRYYAVSFNTRYVSNFVDQAIQILFKCLNRRSQRKSYTWSQFRKFEQQFPPPKVKVYHPLF